MTSEHQRLADLIERARLGCDVASEDLVSKYGAHILRVVRHRLNRTLRPKFDSQDFVQAVWASFFAVLPEREAFDRPEELIAFLADLAQNKVIDAVRQRMMSQKRDINREEPLDPGKASHARRQPSPSDIAIAREEWQRLLDQQPAHHQRMLEMLRAGHGYLEVARELGVNERTIRRIVGQLASRQADET